MIRAIHYPHIGEFFASRTPGSFHVMPADEDGERAFRYFCPCGCGHEGALVVGEGFKPPGPGATWNWNGSLGEPQLQPSVNHVGHWHGWLRMGYWEKC